MGREVGSLPDEEIDKRLKKVESDKRAHQRLSIVRKYYRAFGSKSLLGWDYVRYIALCRWGFLVGYLSYDEAWQHVMRAATILQSTFSSSEDLGQNYLVGREFWSPEATIHNGEDFRDAHEWLLSDPDSPWRSNPWDMRLAASPNQ